MEDVPTFLFLVYAQTTHGLKEGVTGGRKVDFETQVVLSTLGPRNHVTTV